MAGKLGMVIDHEGELLHFAAIHDDVNLLTTLLDAGVHGSVDSVDNKGLTALHKAAIHGSAKCVLLLLKREADPNAISGLEDNCSTPLHHAAERGHLECLKELLEYEADLDLMNNDGKTAFDIARSKQNTKCLDYLLQVQEQRRKEYEEAQREELYDLVVYGNYHDAKEIIESIPIESRIQAINNFYRGPNTLLYKASCGGYRDIVELLLDNGADGRQNPDNGISPLYAAAFFGHLKIVEVLCERIPHLRTLRTTTDLTEPMHAACSHGYVKVVRYLLQFRGPIPVDDADGEVPNDNETDNRNRHTETRHQGTVGCYIKVNTTNQHGFTPLHLACKHGHRAVVHELLKCGPLVKGDVNTTLPPHRVAIDPKNDAGQTPLHCAVARGWYKIAELLLKNGADVNAVMTNDNCTALQIACRLNDEALVQLLLDFGARDTDEVARIDSVRKGKDKLTQILLSNGVYNDTSYRAQLTAEERALDLCPVLVAWHNRKLDILKERWIIDSVLALNRHVHNQLVNDVHLKMKLITRINLSNNALTDVPVIIFQLPSLQTLDLSCNNISRLPEPRNIPPERLNEDNVTENASVSSSGASSSTDSCDGSRTENNWNCHLLEVLELQKNQLTSVPDCVFRLESLIQLDVSNNQIMSLPYDMWLAPALKSVLITGNKLRCLPSFPEDFDGGFLSSKSFTRSTSSPSSTVDGTDSIFMTDTGPLSPGQVSSRISNRRPTWEESEDSSEPEDINDHLEEKTGLDRLDISDNQIYALPPGLACLAPHLTRLNVSGNKISEISGAWALPAFLSLLDLSNNSLTRFDLSNRQIGMDKTCYSAHQQSHQSLTKATSFPQGLTHLANAKTKFCRHRSHRSLLHLRQLNLSGNKLEQLPLVMGSKSRQPGFTEILFPALQSLGLANNKLREVPLHIGKLEKLGSLLLSGNKIECLPPELGLCSGLYELKLYELSLRYPPRHVLERKLVSGQTDVMYIIGFLKSVYENSKPYPHIKLMLVGLGNIGKTSLLELLRKEGSGSYQLPGYQPGFHKRKQTANEKASGTHNVADPNVSTVGVEVCDWTYSKKHLLGTVTGPEVKFSTWDFGGQHEYYATHSCFLSRRALYLLLWKMTEGEKGIEQLEPWLLNIQARAGDSPVIIVGTHLDKMSPHFKKKGGYVDKLHLTIMNRYVSKELGGGVNSLTEKGLPRVLYVTEVSCKTETNIRELRNIVYDTVLEMKNEDQGSLLESLVPASYIRVEEAVTRICKKLEQEDKYPVLEDKQFRTAVEEELQKKGWRLTRSEELDQAVKFLHGYGVLLHYEDPSLKDLYFVDPQWLCDMLAHVITVRNVNPYIRNGILKVSDLRNQIFRGERFPSSWVDKYIDLMSKFEVAIKISEKYLLVPSLLPEKQKDCLKVSESVYPEVRSVMDGHAYLKHSVYRRQYLMSYVPSGYWARLITRLIADNRVCRIVTMCCQVVNSTATNADEKKAEGDELIRAAPPEWACWRTGIELSCFGAKLLRVCQLEKALTFYGASHKSNKPLFINDKMNDQHGYTIEVLAPCIGLQVERFKAVKKTHSSEGEKTGTQEKIGFRVVSVTPELKTAAQLLAIAVEHMDNLLADWYSGLDSFVTATERKLVQRVVPCPKCLQDAISVDPMAQHENKEPAAAKTPTAESETNATPPDDKKEGKESARRERGAKRRSLRNKKDVADGVTPEKDDKDKASRGANAQTESRSRSKSAEDSSVQESPKVSEPTVNGGTKFEQSNKSKPNSTDSTSGYSSEGDHSPLHASPNHNAKASEPSATPKTESAGCIFAFTFEEGVKRLNMSEPMCCTFHGEVPLKEIFPDVVFVDLPEDFVIPSDNVIKEKFLAAGSYGSVSKGKLKSHDDTMVTVAIKVPYDTDPGNTANTFAVRDAMKNKRFIEGALTEASTTMYKSIRQELSILVPVKHDHIIKLLGVSLSPLAMVIEFAPLGSLDQRLRDYKRAGRKLDPYVIQKSCVQVAQALRYLHHHNIIYRDLKSENVLVWSFPEPSVRVPIYHTVHLKLADYGISRAVAISGTKGLGGTSGFMAPEIVFYYGKESYTLKVDSFSFGSFMYELITLHQPFHDIGNKANLANQFVAEGKRPRLSPREKRTPVLILSLMYRCWTHDQDRRPSSNDIYGLASLKEFPRLSDAFDLGDTFRLQCAVSSSRMSSAGSSEYADSRYVIGSVLWLCGKENKGTSMTPCMTVLSYMDGRRSMLKEITLKKGIVVACSVGSTIWLATETGAILVYCALTYRPLALGKPINQRFIHAILHSPICHSVLVAQIDGSVFKYSDKVSSYQHFVSRTDLTSHFNDISEDVSIRELIPSSVYQGDMEFGYSSIHCLAAVKRQYILTSKNQETSESSNETHEGVHMESSNSGEEFSDVKISYELWCGQERGLINVLDLESLRKIESIPVTNPERGSPSVNVTVRYLETLRTFEDDDREEKSRSDMRQDTTLDVSESVWVVLYPGTTVYRWNVNQRNVESTVDASMYSPQTDLNSHKTSKKTKALHVSKAQITAILVVQKDLYIGTSFGCLIVCDNLTLVPRIVLRCYEEPLECLMPLRMTSSRREEGKHRNYLVLSSGRCCLDRWSGTHEGMKKRVSKECTVLTWLADQWEV